MDHKELVKDKRYGRYFFKRKWKNVYEFLLDMNKIIEEKLKEFEEKFVGELHFPDGGVEKILGGVMSYDNGKPTAITQVGAEEVKDFLHQALQEVYKQGRKDKEDELTQNVLLEGEPRNFIGMDRPDGYLSKKYKDPVRDGLEVVVIGKHEAISRLKTYISNLLDSTALEGEIFYTKAELYKIGGLSEDEKLGFSYRVGREHENNKLVAEQHKRIKLAKDSLTQKEKGEQ